MPAVPPPPPPPGRPTPSSRMRSVGGSRNLPPTERLCVGGSRHAVDPDGEIFRDPRSGVRRRRHLREGAVDRDSTAAAKRSDLPKRVTARPVRHGSARRLIAAGYDLCTVREPLEHRDLWTTVVDTHVRHRSGSGVVGPANCDLPGADPVLDHVRTRPRVAPEKRGFVETETSTTI